MSANRFLLALTVLLGACATEDAVDSTHIDESAALPADMVAPPMALELTALNAGQPFTMTAFGANPGDTVYFIYSLNGTTCPACGPALPGMGGLRANINSPIKLFPAGTAVADAGGIASYTFNVPGTAPAGLTLGVEAAVRTGFLGLGSYQSESHAVQVGAATCGDDGLESNDVPTLGSPGSAQHTTGLRSCPSDDDWFVLQANANDMLRTSVVFSHADGDVDIEMYDSDGVSLIDSSNSTDDDETMHTIVPHDGTYYLRIRLYGESDRLLGNDYALDVNTYREPAVYSMGTFSVAGTYNADLDAGKQVGNADRSQSDFFWQQMTATTRQLSPEGGARFLVYGSSEPHYGWCLESAAYWTATDDAISGSDPGFSQLAPGTWLCGITADGHVFKSRVDGITADVTHTMTMTTTTWDSPFAWRVVDDGEVTIPGTWMFDFETGSLGADSTMDMFWQQQTSTTRQMVGTNGGLLAATNGLDIAGPIGCESYTLSTTPISGNDLASGPLSRFRNVCVRTNNGATAAFNVVGVDNTQNNGLMIGYTRWEYGPRPSLVQSFRVRGTWLADLDTAAEVGGVPEADLFWRQMTPTTRQLEPANGAELAVMGASQPQHDDCALASFSTAPVDGSGVSYGSMPIGTWFCAVTNGGAVAKFQITNIDPTSNHTLSITETKW